VNKEHKLGFGHYWNYFKEGQLISLKERVEFKVTLYSGMGAELFYTVIFLFFGFLFANQFGDVFGWTFADYALLGFFGNISHHIAGLFYYNKQINWRRKEGTFNGFLYLPGNKFNNYFFSRPFHSPLPYLFLDFFVNLPLILFFIDIQITTLLIGFILSAFFALLYVSTFYLLDSFSWYFIELGSTLSGNILEQINDNVLYNYPGTFFKQSWVRYILFLSPMYFIATITVPILNGTGVFTFSTELFLILLGISLAFFITYFNWKYGLKHYEAYG
jgi:ABC-type uncharacterized transport system permease subunit